MKPRHALGRPLPESAPNLVFDFDRATSQAMGIKGSAYIAGAFEHPTRKATAALAKQGRLLMRRVETPVPCSRPA